MFAICSHHISAREVLKRNDINVRRIVDESILTKIDLKFLNSLHAFEYENCSIILDAYVNHLSDDSVCFDSDCVRVLS